MTATPILINATITGSDSQVFSVAQKDVSVYWNIPVPTISGTIQLQLQEVDPGDQTTAIPNTLTQTGFISLFPNIGHIQLPSVGSEFVRVSWNISGSPEFDNTYITLIDKPAEFSIPGVPTNNGGFLSPVGSTNSVYPGGTVMVGGMDNLSRLRSVQVSSAGSNLGAQVIAGIDAAGGTPSPYIDATTRAAGVAGVTADGGLRTASPVLVGGVVAHGNSVTNTVKTLSVDDQGRVSVNQGASSYLHLTGSASGTLASGSVNLHRIVVNSPPVGSASLTIYDNNVSPAAPVVATINLLKAPVGAIPYDVATKFGLSYFLSGSNPGDVTIVYG